MLNANIKVDHIFVSTHTSSAFGDTHNKCLDILNSMNYKIIFSDPTRGGMAMV